MHHKYFPITAEHNFGIIDVPFGTEVIFDKMLVLYVTFPIYIIYLEPPGFARGHKT